MLARSCLRSTRVLAGARNGAINISKVRIPRLTRGRGFRPQAVVQLPLIPLWDTLGLTACFSACGIILKLEGLGGGVPDSVQHRGRDVHRCRNWLDSLVLSPLRTGRPCFDAGGGRVSD